MENKIFIHPLSEVQTKNIGKGTTIWQYSVILKNAIIGEFCNINSHTFIENNVQIGNNATVKCGVYLWDGTIIEDNVFIGPNATFVNDIYPRSKKYLNNYLGCLLKYGCSIGANVTILGGIVIGKFALVGAGSVVTKNLPNNALAIGNPAKIVGWVSEEGQKLKPLSKNIFINELNGEKYVVEENDNEKFISKCVI